MSNVVFRPWSQDSSYTSYLKIGDMEQYKEFILSMRKNGKMQKEILEALKGKGVELTDYRLKRLLDQWGASKNNMTKKCQMGIRFKIEKRRREDEKKAHKVVMKRSKRVLTEEEINEIMARSPGYFKGVKPNSQDTFVISTPTPKGGRVFPEDSFLFSENVQGGYDKLGDGQLQPSLPFDDAPGEMDIERGGEVDSCDALASDEMMIDPYHDIADDSDRLRSNGTGCQLVPNNVPIVNLPMEQREGGAGAGQEGEKYTTDRREEEMEQNLTDPEDDNTDSDDDITDPEYDITGAEEDIIDYEEEDGRGPGSDSGEEYQEDDTTDSEGGDWEDDGTDFEDDMELVDDVVEFYVNEGRKHKDEYGSATAGGHLIAEAEPEGSVEELKEVISSGLKGVLLRDAGAEPSESIGGGIKVHARGESGHDRGAMGAEEETALGRYARKRRYLFWEQVKRWKREAKSFLGEVTWLSKKRGVSLEKAADIVSRQWENTGNPYDERLPYHIYEQILGEEYDEDEDEGTLSVLAGNSNVEGVDNNYLCQILETNFTRLERAARRRPPEDIDRLNFDRRVVHVPFILRKFGSNHFFAANALNWAGTMSKSLIGDFELGDVLQVSALCAYNSTGTATLQDALGCVYSVDNLEGGHGLAVAADKARNDMPRALVQRYGRDHPKTLHFLSRLAYIYWDEGFQARSKLMVYGIVKTIERSYPIYPTHLKNSIKSCWGQLGDLLVLLGRSDLAARFLPEPSSWEGKPGVAEAAVPTGTCTYILGDAYANLGKYTQSLRALLSCWNGHSSKMGMDHPQSLQQIQLITKVMNLRGPQLYLSLDSTLTGILESMRKAGRAQNPVYRELRKAVKGGGFETQEYENIVAQLSAPRSRTPDLGDFMYSQGLECWLAHQDIYICGV
ncbi:hypothetical protein TWF730_011077 [Orbilia blumenaviensis]|uniref:Clr5 domain-containing protein n=1 Tax=Orbilia blumenaviensis TaxID=1796055 RepID=A0AAV9UN39_9PEZI